MPNTRRRRPRSLAEAIDRHHALDRLLATIDPGDLLNLELPAATRDALIARAERLQRRKRGTSGRAGRR